MFLRALVSVHQLSPTSRHHVTPDTPNTLVKFVFRRDVSENDFSYITTSSGTIANQGSYVEATMLQLLITIPDIVMQVARAIVQHGRHVTLAGFQRFQIYKSFASEIVNVESRVNLAIRVASRDKNSVPTEVETNSIMDWVLQPQSANLPLVKLYCILFNGV